MKKFKFLGLALFAAVLTVGFVSCGNDEDEEIVIPTKDEKPIDDILKRPVGSIKGIEDKATVAMEIIADKDSKCPVEKFILTKDKHVFVPTMTFYAMAPSRAYTPTIVYEGTYEMNGTMITMSFPVRGMENITVDAADIITKIIFGDTGYGAQIKELPEPTEILDQSLCREWVKPSYQAVVMFDGLCAFNKTNDSFFTLQNQMLDALNKKDVKLDLLKAEIKGMKFFTNGTAHVIYSNNDIEVVTWNWKNKAQGVMNMTINGNNVTVDVRFKEGNPNEATFVISGDFSALGDAGRHTISGRLIVTMKN